MLFYILYHYIKGVQSFSHEELRLAVTSK